MPGTPLGTFNVTGTLASNTCGAGQNAPNPWTFQVQLSLDGSVLYWWDGDAGDPYLSGVLSGGVASFDDSETGYDPADASASCAQTSNGNWYNPQTSAPCTPPAGCTMTRSDAYAITLGSTKTTFTGTLGYTFTVASGSDCSSQLSSAGGTYDVLPCTLTYSLTASH
jgi:hypothetical protein